MNHGSDHDSHSGSNESPLEILKRRFAAGEITREQYEEMKRVILGDDGSRQSSHAAH
ncbi:MAG: SHOCT domain-containing protein [Thermoplasmata archaeon]